MLRFKEGAPVLDDAIRESVHKSYTDCFDMLGFVGGDWGFATNTTLVEGDKAPAPTATTRLPQKDRLLSVFLLGWESIEVGFRHSMKQHNSIVWTLTGLSIIQLHEDATKTALFAEELGKLGPHVDSTSGGWYVTLRKHE